MPCSILLSEKVKLSWREPSPEIVRGAAVQLKSKGVREIFVRIV